MGFPSSLVITNENVKGISRNVLYGTILISYNFWAQIKVSAVMTFDIVIFVFNNKLIDSKK